ncbi:MAG: hypothetical protein LBF78_11265 [Treponema sp.]|jgi:hypothetical protein|nr:hypothetical protein [Treponema sp.]
MSKRFSHSKKVYKYFGNCLFVGNGIFEVIVPLEFGIRILGFSCAGNANLFYEQEKGADYLCTKEGWRVYGGHRFAFAPESEKTYWPDNVPVRYSVLEDGIGLEQEQDGYMNIVKSMEIRFSGEELIVDHRIRNVGTEELYGAPWTITELAAGGVMTMPWSCPKILPLPGDDDALPNRFVSMWNTTSLADSRLRFERELVEIKQLPVDDYFKLGFRSEAGILRYKNRNGEFIKKARYESAAVYPDNNVNLEVYACRYMIELETLAPLCFLKPGEICEHRELWNIN